jgi:hypothetical protein
MDDQTTLKIANLPRVDKQRDLINNRQNGQPLAVMAKRSEIAAEKFCQDVREQFGFSQKQSKQILAAYIKFRIVKLNWVEGVYRFNVGGFWDKSVMENAITKLEEYRRSKRLNQCKKALKSGNIGKNNSQEEDKK